MVRKEVQMEQQYRTQFQKGLERVRRFAELDIYKLYSLQIQSQQLKRSPSIINLEEVEALLEEIIVGKVMDELIAWREETSIERKYR